MINGVWREVGRRDAFTVLEMLVVLGISAFLSTIFVGYGANLKDQMAVFREEARLEQVLFKAKTFAIQAREVEGGAACGYGVNFDRNARTYQIYLKKKNLDGKCPASWAYSSEDGVIGSVFTVDAKVDLSESESMAVAFEPPRPEVYVVGGNGTEARFRLCTVSEPKLCREVVVTKVGQITTDK